MDIGKITLSVIIVFVIGLSIITLGDVLGIINGLKIFEIFFCKIFMPIFCCIVIILSLIILFDIWR